MYAYCVPHAYLYSWNPEGGVRSTGMRVVSGCEPTAVGLKPNLGLPEPLSHLSSSITPLF